MPESVVTYVAMLKEYYTLRQIANMTFRNAPWLAMCPKNTDIEGESWDIPLIVADPQAGSATFATGQGLKGSTTTSKFQINTINEYSFAAVNRKVMKASRSNKGAFLPAVRPNVDGAINTCKRSLAITMYRDGSGAKAQVQAIVGDVLTLGSVADGATKHEVTNLHKGESLQFADAKTGGILRAGQTKISAIDKSGGTITITAADITGLAVDDFIFRDGDRGLVVTGLEGWIPSTAPTPGDSHFGLDRSNNPTELAGVIYDGTGQQIHEAGIDGQSNVATLGDGAPDHWFMHPSVFRAFLKEMDAKVQLDTYRVNQTISFKGFTIQGDAGEIRVIPDRYCIPKNTYMLQLDTWECGSMGVVPDIFDRDTDQEMLREASSDGYEMRIGGYVNLGCHAPGYNGVVTVDLQA